MERRELFSFLSSSVTAGKEERKVVVRPPYYDNEEDFQTKCLECEGVCAVSCPENIIIIGEDKTPFLNFSSRGCTYCDECAKVCPSGVLELSKKALIDVGIVINEQKCLSWQGVMCFSCKDPCFEDAIDFQAMFMPVINDKCTSCGFCIGRCPADAIDIIAQGEE